MKHIIAIMAGGLGKRMNSSLPKVLHNLNGKPMLCTLIETAYNVNPFAILIIVGKYMQIIKDTIEAHVPENILNIIQYVYQSEALGTGHAVNCCIPVLLSFCEKDDRILILSGDTPLVSESTMKSMLNSDKCLAMITNYDCNDISSYNKFKDYGKVTTNLTENTIIKITEKKDCNENELKINVVNCGIYCYSFDVLFNCISKITNCNSQNEYYLTDIIQIANNMNYKTHTFELENNLQYEIIGVNTTDQLKELELILNDKNLHLK